MALQSLDDLYLDQLRDLYSAEDQILDALPKMIDKARNDELREALEEHLEETRGQRDRLQKIFDSLGEKPEGEHCEGMEGLLEEGSEMLEKEGDEDVLDAGMIASAQRVEHYEIAGYGTARTYAKRLGREEDVDLLQETLDEESNADEKLTRIAEATVNRRAERAAAD